MDRSNDKSDVIRFSRRDFLRYAGLYLGGFFLAGCSSQIQLDKTSWPQATPVPEGEATVFSGIETSTSTPTDEPTKLPTQTPTQTPTEAPKPTEDIYEKYPSEEELNTRGITRSEPRIPTELRNTYINAPQEISSPWVDEEGNSESAIKAYDENIRKIVFVNANSDVIGMYNAGPNKVEQLPDGVVWMYGMKDTYIFSSDPKNRVMYARDKNGKEIDGRKDMLEIIRTLMYLMWKAYKKDEVVERGAYDKYYFVEGEGKKYFNPVPILSYLVNSQEVFLGKPTFLISNPELFVSENPVDVYQSSDNLQYLSCATGKNDIIDSPFHSFMTGFGLWPYKLDPDIYSLNNAYGALGNKLVSLTLVSSNASGSKESDMKFAFKP